jgi:Fe-Mn family superoxide dismutase
MKLQDLAESKQKEQLELIKLPYAMSALEPIMERKVVEFHYSVLSKGYVDRYNRGEGDPEFNRAGALLHNLWWPQLMAPKLNNRPRGAVADLMEKTQGGWDEFKETFTKTALDLQGSGWCYMAKNGEIKTLKNQSWRSDVIMPIDLWEHSYTPFTLRKDYLKTIWRIIDWNVINHRLSAST